MNVFPLKQLKFNGKQTNMPKAFPDCLNYLSPLNLKESWRISESNR